VAGQAAAGPLDSGAAGPARPVPRLLQHRQTAPRPRPTPPGPRPPRTASSSTRTGGSATTPSTRPAASPSGTTHGCTTSDSDAASPEPRS
jgi:hypothetical protein